MITSIPSASSTPEMELEEGPVEQTPVKDSAEEAFLAAAAATAEEDVPAPVVAVVDSVKDTEGGVDAAVQEVPETAEARQEGETLSSAVVAPQVAVLATPQVSEQVAPQVMSPQEDVEKETRKEGAQDGDKNPEQVSKPLAVQGAAQVTEQGAKLVAGEEARVEANHPGVEAAHPVVDDVNTATAVSANTAVLQHPTATFADDKGLPAKGGVGNGGSSAAGLGNGEADSASGSGTGGSWAGISIAADSLGGIGSGGEFLEPGSPVARSAAAAAGAAAAAAAAAAAKAAAGVAAIMDAREEEQGKRDKAEGEEDEEATVVVVAEEVAAGEGGVVGDTGSVSARLSAGDEGVVGSDGDGIGAGSFSSGDVNADGVSAREGPVGDMGGVSSVVPTGNQGVAGGGACADDIAAASGVTSASGGGGGSGNGGAAGIPPRTKESIAAEMKAFLEDSDEEVFLAPKGSEGKDTGKPPTNGRGAGPRVPSLTSVSMVSFSSENLS